MSTRPHAGWVLLVHELPPRPTRFRVRVWRQLQKLGALALKNSVYVLPFREKTHEAFQWLRQEIESAGGEASVFRADAIEGADDGELMERFTRERNQEYARLTARLKSLADAFRHRSRKENNPARRAKSLETELERLGEELERIRGIDFFGSPNGAAATATWERCRALAHRTPEDRSGMSVARKGSSRGTVLGQFRGQRWVTRRDVGIDRLACAWLIRKFVDPRARFEFVASEASIRHGIPFDTFRAELGHHGEDCTFETMLKNFGLAEDAALRRLAEIIHAMDLADAKYHCREAAGLEAVVSGLARAYADDRQRIRRAAPLFESLYAHFRSSSIFGGTSTSKSPAGKNRRATKSPPPGRRS